MKDCNKFDTGMAEPKLENLWSNPFVFSSTIKYLKYKNKKHMDVCMCGAHESMPANRMPRAPTRTGITHGCMYVGSS